MRKTKAVRNNHLQAVLKDRLANTSTELMYAGIAGIAVIAEVKLKPDNRENANRKPPS